MPVQTYAWNEDELARLDLQASYAWRLLEPHLLAVGLKPGCRVLDAGCGTGRVTARIAEAVGPRGTVTGVDIDATLLGMAASAPMPPQSAPVTWQQGDLYNLGDPEPYDLVVAQMVLQHLSEPQRVVAELARVVRPGGGVVLLDVDDALLDVSPVPEGFWAFHQRAIARQAEQGGDREIGRRLAGMAHRAGLIHVVPGVELFCAPPNPMPHFLGGALLFKPQLFAPEQQAEAAQQVAGFCATLAQPGGFGMVGMFSVHAQRPIES